MSALGDATFGMFGSGAPNYGQIARRGESQRQGIINLGLKQINAVYDGGSAPFYLQARRDGKGFNSGRDYYNINSRGNFQPYWGNGANPGEGKFQSSGIGKIISSGGGDLGAAMGIRALGLGGLFGHKQSPRDVARDAFKHNQLFELGATQDFEGFQPEFFDQRAKDYVNFALPQVSDQYRTNRDAVNFGLANRGLQGSSVEGQANTRLERTAGQARQNVADTGIAQANELKKNVEESRQQDIAQLYQSANPAQGMQSAIANASQLRIPSTFAPLGDLFSNIARQYYTNQALNNYRNQGAGGPDYGLTNYLAPV